MRSLRTNNRIKYKDEWSSFEDIYCRPFTYLLMSYSVILRYRGIGGWTIKIINHTELDELLVFNSGIGKMSISINDDMISEIDGWFYEDVNELKDVLETDLIKLLRKYEEYKET